MVYFFSLIVIGIYFFGPYSCRFQQNQMANGNKQLTLQKNETRANLEKLLGSTALILQNISSGDEQLILCAGFDVKRKPASIVLHDRPENLKAIPGLIRGSLKIS